MRRWGWILLPMLVLVGLRIGAMGSPAVRASGWVVDFFDDFAANTGWSVSTCGDAPGGYDGCQWPGQIQFGFNDGGAAVLRLSQDGGVTFPLAGREGLFNSIPAGAPWAFEIRFRFPEVTAYGVNIGMGSGSWTTQRISQTQPLRSDWRNAFAVHQDASGSPPALRAWVFGTKILERPAPDTAWHTIRVEVQPDGTWRAFVDGGLAGSGSGAFRPNMVWFGNYYEQAHRGNWSDLHIDYLRIEHFVDDLPPITTIALDPPSPNGDNGWYRTAVNVSITAADDASGVREIRYRLDGGPWAVYSGPFPVSADGTHTVEAYAVDNAGNVESPPKSRTFRIDATPPTISWSANPSAPDGDNGWYRAPITVTWSCADSLSGIAACPGPSLITGEGTHLTVSGTARDQAGNTASATAGPFRRDATPPAVSGAVDPPPNAYGWSRTPVTITWSGTDALSGVAACDPPTIVATEGANQTVSGACRDRAGNVGTGTVTVSLDFTPPRIVGARSPAPNPDGWNNTDVTVTWSCSDALSGIAVCPDPVVVATEGANQSVTGTARDRADHEAAATVSGISIDKTPPTVSFALDPAPNANGWNRTPVTITWSGSDALSGIAACDPPATVSAEGADQTRIGSCRDRAGNVGSAEARVSIDLTPPRITASRSPSPNAFGWVSVPVTVTFTCEDLLSGIALCPGPVAVAAEGENQSVSGTAKDRADNAASTTLSGISIDFTPPAVQGIPDRPPDHGGWYTAPFTVTWSGRDALSGIRECDASIRYEGPDTASGSLSGSCVDRADNAGEATFAFRYDATPPTIAAVISPTLPDGLSGWWVTPPVVSFACEDAASGIAFCSPPVTVTTEGLAAVVGMAEDFAGWTSTVSAALKVDLSPPSAGLVMPASWCFACSGPVAIGLVMADAVSGVGSWTLRLEAHGSWRAFTGTGPAGSVVWDGQLEGATVQPGDRVTVTLVVRDAAGHEGSAQAFLAIAAPSAPPPLSPPTPASTPTRRPTPTRIRPVRTPTATPVLGETPAPKPTPTPEPTLAPTPVPAPPPPSPAPALVMGVVFLDRNGNGLQDPDEPGIPGAVVEAGGRRIVTGPDGRFWMPVGFRAKLLQLPVGGRLTVADGIRFGVQPVRSRWWLLGLTVGMILLGLAWARDPRPKATRRLTEILRERRMR